MSSIPDTPIDVAAAIVFHEGKLLVAQRPAGSHLAGLWEFPGGKLEPGEAWEGGLRRELREELDIEVEVGCLFEEVTHVYPEKVVHLRFYVCAWTSGAPRALGCAAFRWIAREGLGELPFPPADGRLLGRLADPATAWEFVPAGGASLPRV